MSELEALAALHGKHYWRSLDELARTPAFEAMLHREFPRQASEWLPSMDRRKFLQLMAASLALGGLAACQRPAGKILPYVRQPEDVLPGTPLFFATATTRGGYATGVLVESHEGRPTKLEGNPGHPASLGATDAMMQASVLSLYDPDRSQAVLHQGEISTLDACLAATREALKHGATLRILTETVTSPSLAERLQKLVKQYPGARWHTYEPVHRDGVLAGAQLAFGKALEPHYHFDQADVILSLDADFLVAEPLSLAYARAFMDARRVRKGHTAMNRLYALETTPGLTGATADHRLAVGPRELDRLARAIASALGVGPAEPAGAHADWVAAVAADLQAHRGRGLILVGHEQPAHLHALAHVLNQALGNAGRTVTYAPTAQVPGAPLAQLTQEMAAGEVDVLLMLSGNPAYAAPADLNFAQSLKRVKHSVHLGLYPDETAALTTWHVPEAHALESWGDPRAYDGTVTLQQPLIAPLYDGLSALELVALLIDPAAASGEALLREFWAKRPWEAGLRDGFLKDTAFKAVTPTAPFAVPLPPLPAPKDLEVVLRADPTVWDGRHANNGWLQELPKPLTKLTWDNAAMLSPATARRLGLANEDVVTLTSGDRHLDAPIWILPGQPDDVVTLHLGYGRKSAGRVGTGTGFDAYALVTAASPWTTTATLRKTGKTYPLAVTQVHHAMEGHDFIRTVTAAQLPTANFQERPLDSLLKRRVSPGHAWAMSIDLNTCIGCNACVVACQAENNIPVVGKEQVAAGREMHWLRVDRYYEGPVEAPTTAFQPVPCMQCEDAPCEVVCPTGATVHSEEGLNDMTYNRCVGTRYCSNNCPYKVRRFNFFQYADVSTESLKAGRNPQVSVRERGVMEKCTYCVQRINEGRINAERDGRTLADGEIVTACQGACPTQAIVFGDKNDPTSAIAKLKSEPLDYALLAELNTYPRTTYLARATNPNPALGPHA